jgi:energy-coupling factor transport system ATP-binding protein
MQTDGCPVNAIEYKDFSFRYIHQKGKALEDITLDIAGGSVIGILGPAGAGKSTLVKALNGLVPSVDIGYQDGDVIVEGFNTRDHEVNHMAHHVSIVLQNPDMQIFLTRVRDDIAFGPANLGIPREEVFERVDKALSDTELIPLADRNPNDLSGGEQQALAIAGVLAMEPSVMAFDEPISMLDPIGKEHVMYVMRQVTEIRKTTSLTTESGADIEAIAEVVDELILLDQGKLVMRGTPHEVMVSDAVYEAGVGRPQVTDLILELNRRGHQFDHVPITLEEALETIRHKLTSLGITIIERPSSYPLNDKPDFGETVLKVENLHHWYNEEVHALKGISFDIQQGQIIGIIGQNGSGKTTLARHLVGLLKPTNEDAVLEVKGQNITNLKIDQIIKMVNYVFQNPDDQLFAETIWDEVEFAPKMMELEEEETKQLTEEALEVFDLSPYRRRYVLGLDEDLKTYLAITSILPLKPDILFIDEPTTGLDTRGEAKMMESLNRLRDEQGKTIIIITHNMKTIGNHCDRVLVMSQGELILDGATRDIFVQDEELLKADIRPPQITRLGQLLAEEFNCPRDILTVEEFIETLDYSLNKSGKGN